MLPERHSMVPPEKFPIRSLDAEWNSMKIRSVAALLFLARAGRDGHRANHNSQVDSEGHATLPQFQPVPDVIANYRPARHTTCDDISVMTFLVACSPGSKTLVPEKHSFVCTEGIGRDQINCSQEIDNEAQRGLHHGLNGPPASRVCQTAARHCRMGNWFVGNNGVPGLLAAPILAAASYELLVTS